MPQVVDGEGVKVSGLTFEEEGVIFASEFVDQMVDAFAVSMIYPVPRSPRNAVDLPWVARERSLRFVAETRLVTRQSGQGFDVVGVGGSAVVVCVVVVLLLLSPSFVLLVLALSLLLLLCMVCV